jgi:hypothetical protein
MEKEIKNVIDKQLMIQNLYHLYNNYIMNQEIQQAQMTLVLLNTLLPADEKIYNS